MLAAYLLEPQRRTYDLVELAADAGIGLAEAVAEEAEGGAEGGQMALGEEVEAGLDPTEEARLVAALADAQRPRLEELELEPLLRDVELPLVHVLAAMEREGLKLDAVRLAEVGAGFGERIATLEKEIFELAEEEFTIGSPQQVGRILFEKLELTRKRRGKTGFSTDARVLAQIRDEHPIVEKIEQWRELTKLKNTYLDSLPDLIDPQTERVHTTFNQASTTTGRLSSTNPNLQNIPIRTEIGRPVRACFVAEKGARLLSADYSQVELRVLAHVADEGVLKEIFAAGEDVHAATAAEVFDISREEVDVGQRSKAKMVNFGIVYGLTGFGLADRLNIPRKEGEEFVARYLERFPAVRAFREETIERAQEEGFVKTLMGRRRSIPELRSGNPNTRRLGERLAVNTVIQGTAADVIKVAMVRCQRSAARHRCADPARPADPRRAAVRGAARRDGRCDRAGAARDVRRLPARPGLGGRRRRGEGLAGREVGGRRPRVGVSRSRPSSRQILSPSSRSIPRFHSIPTSRSIPSCRRRGSRLPRSRRRPRRSPSCRRHRPPSARRHPARRSCLAARRSRRGKGQTDPRLPSPDRCWGPARGRSSPRRR